MKPFVTALALLAFSATLRAGPPEPAPPIAWAVQAGGPKHDKTRGLTIDAAGNIYMTGEFSGVATFGQFPVASVGDLDFFIAKYSPDGKCLWVRRAGGTKTDRGYGVAVDAAGNVFVTGPCQGSDATFDGTAFPNNGDFDLFVASYDASGRLRWLKSGGGAGYDYGHSVALDAKGNCYVTGSFAGKGQFAGAEVANPTGAHTFVAKFANDGELTWLRVSSGPGGNAGEHVAVDAEGNCVIVGGTSGASKFDDVALTVPGGRNPFAAKFDADGKPQWAFTAAGSNSGLFASVALDGKGEACVCGMFQTALELGGQRIESHGLHDVVIAKLDASGKLKWFRTGGGPSTDYALGIAADKAGNCFVAGEFTGEAIIANAPLKAIGMRDLYVAKFGDGGALRWIRSAGGTRSSLAYCVALSPDGGVCVSGAFDGDAAYGATKLTSRGSNDVLLLKLER